ncbi:hypothetical protein EJ08DRAFT_653410 [Tothia fuscella]|uniref:Uncharacterized protein n=1 Tax=Tothia fuscella TaxID=1048955 RepID=A0A9P4NHB2_9PEZI|nr:hypothetical protein EJ08DRAFT_653410 [Tothia fuscella]
MQFTNLVVALAAAFMFGSAVAQVEGHSPLPNRFKRDCIKPHYPCRYDSECCSRSCDHKIIRESKCRA